MNRTPERLFDQIEAIDENPDVVQPAGLELREMRVGLLASSAVSE